MGKPTISKAVIANMKGTVGIVLWSNTDSQIEHEIGSIGSRRLDDLGLDNAPDGISIWEGAFAWTPGPWDCPADGQLDPDGKFRAPTDEEWVAIREGRSPWRSA